MIGGVRALMMNHRFEPFLYDLAQPIEELEANSTHKTSETVVIGRFAIWGRMR